MYSQNASSRLRAASKPIGFGTRLSSRFPVRILSPMMIAPNSMTPEPLAKFLAKVT